MQGTFKLRKRAPGVWDLLTWDADTEAYIWDATFPTRRAALAAAAAAGLIAA